MEWNGIEGTERKTDTQTKTESSLRVSSNALYAGLNSSRYTIIPRCFLHQHQLQ